MNYQTWHKMQVIARDVLGDDVKRMLLGVHDDNGLTKLERQFHGRRAPYVQIERYAATSRFAIDLKPVEVLALELLAHISKFARLVDYADEWTPEKLEKPVESVVQAMLAKLREKLDPDSEVTPEQLEKAKQLEFNYRMGFLKPVTPEQLKTNWQETRGICTQLAPYLPEPDRTALLALLPPIEDDAPVVEETSKDRRARWLDMREDEESRVKRGALQRVYERELLTNPKADRSYIGKEIKIAKKERKEVVQGGAMFEQLVRNGKRTN
jgi:hypothetical protein